MPRIALGVEYDGSAFFGCVANETVVVHGAGRTDTGVHALQQVVHFDTTAARNARQWVLGANANLPDDVRVQWAQVVPDEFDARLAGSPIRRIGHERWLRNLAVALGNSAGGEAAIDALRARVGDASALVREHVQWALQRLGESPPAEAASLDPAASGHNSG